MSLLDFKPWPKTPRLNRDMIITEKIDGTNAAVIVKALPDDLPIVDVLVEADRNGKIVDINGTLYVVGAQSRKRVVTPLSDNFGFAAWVWQHAEALAGALGEGYHYGEWWGSGVQRGYGIQRGRKYFSLFNVHRYGGIDFAAAGLEDVSAVPVLYTGPFDTNTIQSVLASLKETGSNLPQAPGFPAEGIVVFHSASGTVYKVLSENDEVSKTEAGVS
jgi:hypothetical protein